MLNPFGATRLTLLPLAASALAALLIGWANTENGVPADSPLRAHDAVLDLGMAVTHARLRFKEGLAADLITGRLSLREATRRLRAYLEKEPRLEGVSSGRDCVARLPGATEEQRCANSLLAFVRDALHRSPREAERLAVRLRREMDASR
jgi:hypothetical protein